jgi:hypothetical protein
MQVSAIASPRYPGWRWRISGYNGEVLEESHERYPTISAAVTAGTERLVIMNEVRR